MDNSDLRALCCFLNDVLLWDIECFPLLFAVHSYNYPLMQNLQVEEQQHFEALWFCAGAIEAQLLKV